MGPQKGFRAPLKGFGVDTAPGLGPSSQNRGSICSCRPLRPLRSVGNTCICTYVITLRRHNYTCHAIATAMAHISPWQTCTHVSKVESTVPYLRPLIWTPIPIYTIHQSRPIGQTPPESRGAQQDPIGQSLDSWNHLSTTPSLEAWGMLPRTRSQS